ncbi:MAG: peptidyl-prolyl cis-trans isomerase [Treponema sp.]|nr:peptidyl-prolyl cis-trans isomerase [Treponema sp.]
MAQEKQHKKIDNVKIGAIIILILSALVFVFFGFGADVYSSILNRSSNNLVFGKYEGKPIEYKPGTDYYTRIQSVPQQFQNAGYEMNTQVEYTVFRQAFIQTIQDRLYTDSVKKSGYLVTDDQVNRVLVQSGLFMDSEGKFSQKAYSNTDASQIATLRSSISDDLYFNRYSADLLGSDETLDGKALYGLKNSSKETEFIAKMASEKRSFTVASFNTGDFPMEEAIAYGKENAQKFIRYDLSVITVDEKSDADHLLKQLTSNEITFEDAVSEKSAGYYAETDGKISSPYYYQIANTVANEEDITKVTELASGDYSPVIQTARGYSIFRADGPSKAADFNDETIKTLVHSYLSTNESGYIENYYMDIARTFIADARLNGFSAACAKYGIEPVEVPAFPLNYGNTDFIANNPSDVTPLTGLYLNENALQQLFTPGLNQISEPFVLSGYVTVAQCTGIQSEAVETDSFASLVADSDDNAAQTALLRSKKLEDNFTNVYFDYKLSAALAN